MLAALAALLSGASARPLPTRILAFGDSLTAGLVGGSTNRYSPYGDALARSLMDASGHEAEVYSRGVVMESVHAMPARLTKTLQAEGGGFDCALVLGGSNDLWRGDADAIWTSLQALYGELRSSNVGEECALGLVTIPPFEPGIFNWLSFTGISELTDDTRIQVNERIRAECADANDVFLVDLAAFADEPAMARPDGLHFEEAGYRRLGAAAASALQNFCAPPVAG